MRRVLAVLLGVVLVTLGVALATVALGGRGEVAPRGSAICAKEGVRVLARRVAPQDDGVHVRLTNVGRDRRYELRSSGAPTAPAFAGVLPEDGTVELVLALAPGDIELTCLRGSGERLVGRFELVDPGGLWVPDVLDCLDPDSGVFETRYAQEPFEATARRAIVGLRPNDRLVVPGYPETAWHGELHTVVRDGEVVGRIARVLNHGTWNLSVDACHGSGLTRGAVAETGAT